MAKAIAVVLLAALIQRPFKEMRHTVPLTPRGRIYLRTFRGTVDVRGWDRAEVEIGARIEPRNLLGSQAACIESTRVSVDAWSSSIRVAADFAQVPDRVPWWLAALAGACTERPLVHYQLRIPRQAHLTIVDEASSIRITGIDGLVDIKSRGGKVAVTTDR